MNHNEQLEKKISKALGTEVILNDLNQSFTPKTTITRFSGFLSMDADKRKMVQKALGLKREIKDGSMRFQIIVETDEP